jgi:autotransporter translocation and assembly factor TamB
MTIPPPRDGWIDDALRARLGPDATAGAIAFEGRTLRLAGARIPLGAARIEVAEAEVELGAGLPLGALPVSARLVAVRGEVVAGDARVPIAFEASSAESPAWAHGVLRVAGVEAQLSARPGAIDLATARSRLALTLAIDAAGRADGSRLTGSVAFADLSPLVPGDLAPLPEGSVDLDVAIEGSLADPSARGRVHADTLLLGSRARPDAPPIRVDDLSAAVELDRRSFRCSDLRAVAHGARITARGGVPFLPLSVRPGAAPLLSLQIEGAGAPLLAAIAVLLGAPGGTRLPDDLTATGELMIRPDRAASGAITLETPRSHLALQLALAADGGLLGSTLRGRLAFPDAAAAGLFPGPVRPRGEGALDVDTRFSGSLAKPGLTGRLSAARVALAWDGGAWPPCDLEDAAVLVDVDAERFAWHRLAARFGGGTFASSGRAGLAAGAGFHAVLSFQGVRVEQLPTDASGTRELAGVFEGAASGELRVEGTFEGAVTATGRVTVDRPRYLFARAFTPALAPLGLPPVRAEGRGALVADVRYTRGELRVDPIAAPLDGIHVEGGARVDLEGRLGGRVLLHLMEGWLAQSALLALPAMALGRVTVPVELAGTVRAPRLSTDALEVLERMLVKNRLNDAVKSALEGILGAPHRPRR